MSLAVMVVKVAAGETGATGGTGDIGEWHPEQWVRHDCWQPAKYLLSTFALSTSENTKSPERLSFSGGTDCTSTILFTEVQNFFWLRLDVA